MGVQPDICEQFGTSFRRQFVVSWANKSQLQDPFITPNKIFVGDEWRGQYSLVEASCKK
jgi:hypothetical protein